MTSKMLQRKSATVVTLCAIVMLAIPALAYYYDNSWAVEYTSNGYAVSGYTWISWDPVLQETEGAASTSIDDPLGSASANGAIDEVCEQNDYYHTFSCADKTPAYAEDYHIGPDPDGSSAYGVTSHSGTDHLNSTVGGYLLVDARP